MSETRIVSFTAAAGVWSVHAILRNAKTCATADIEDLPLIGWALVESDEPLEDADGISGDTWLWRRVEPVVLDLDMTPVRMREWLDEYRSSDPAWSWRWEIRRGDDG